MEWKNRGQYAPNVFIGDGIPVHDLGDEEFNDLFEQSAFVYDRNRNKWVSFILSKLVGSPVSDVSADPTQNVQTSGACTVNGTGGWQLTFTISLAF